MCGIAGIVNRRSLVQENELRKMSGKLEHRGPDNTGYYIHEKVGLAHTRLSIIDLEGGDQPIVSLDGNMVLVTNGEIYNYIELREELLHATRTGTMIELTAGYHSVPPVIGQWIETSQNAVNRSV